MAEARSEEEEENMRDTREQVVRRQANSSGGRARRRKPEHRLSQGPLSSIRAAFKRTSTRSTSLSETPGDSERERDRERERERERARERDRRRPEITILSAEPLSSSSWFPGASGGFPLPPPPPAQIWGSSIPPSIQPPPSYEEVIREKSQEQGLRPSSSSCSLSSSHSASTTTIATQTDKGSPVGTADAEERPARPPRPPLPFPRAASCDDISIKNDAQIRDLLIDVSLPSNAVCSPSGDQPVHPTSPKSTPARDPKQRPQPRPRSKLSAIDSRVKVETLVKLREDGLATLAARAGSKQEAIQGKYLQELLEAFSSDDWGFPDQRDGLSDTEDEEDAEVMSALKARIQAFEQPQPVDNVGDGINVFPKRPEPQPRPRLLSQPTKSPPPTIAPKPKVLSHKPSSKDFWEEESSPASLRNPDAGAETNSDEIAVEPVSTSGSETFLVPQPVKKPEVAPKPAPELQHPPTPAPSPRDKKTSAAHLKPPPRPAAAPRVSLGAPLPEKTPKRRQTAPLLPPRPTLDLVSGGPIKPVSQEESEKQTGAPTRQVVAAPRSVSAPALAPKPNGPSPSQPETHVVQARPAQLTTTTVSKPPAPAVRHSALDPLLPPRPSCVKPLPLRPPPIKAAPGRPPPPTVNTPLPQPACKNSCVPAVAPSGGQVPSSLQGQKAQKKGPPLPPRPKPGHPLYNSYTKQEVLIVLDDTSPAAPPPHPVDDQSSQTTAPPLCDSLQCLLDLETDRQSEHDLKSDETPGDSMSILPTDEQKKQSHPPLSGPRCVALFDYEGEEEDELTFSQGDIISLLEPVDDEWVRGEIHGRTGIFPQRFADVVEPLESEKNSPAFIQSIVAETNEGRAAEEEEWAVALFDFPGQTEDDLSFHKGALIQVLEHIDHEWRKGRLEGREGLYPAAFTQSCQAQPISEQPPPHKGVAKAVFDFTAESEEELTMKVGDVITEVEAVDEQWIVGVVGGKRGMVPKNYISVVS